MCCHQAPTAGRASFPHPTPSPCVLGCTPYLRALPPPLAVFCECHHYTLTPLTGSREERRGRGRGGEGVHISACHMTVWEATKKSAPVAASDCMRQLSQLTQAQMSLSICATSHAVPLASLPPCLLPYKWGGRREEGREGGWGAFSPYTDAGTTYVCGSSQRQPALKTSLLPACLPGWLLQAVWLVDTQAAVCWASYCQ